MTKISVCLASYNGANYIGDQISSILQQLSSCDELVVSDDHSTDRTIDIVKEFNDNRIRIVVNAGNKGYSGNFENAIRLASGSIIFLSDQDDIWVAGRVKKMIAALEQADLAVSNAIFVDEALVDMGVTLFSLRGAKQGFLANIYKSRYLGACMAFRREILGKLLPFPEKRHLCPHDLWITLVAEFYFKVKILDEPLLLYRRHGSNVSNGGSKSNYHTI